MSICGGGSSPAYQPSSQTTSTVNQSNLPEYARPYYESLLGRAQSTSNDPYDAYGGARIADFNETQTQAQNNIVANQGIYQPNFNQAQSGYQAVQDIGTGVNFNPSTVTNSYSANTYTPDTWNTQTASQYMDPYARNVIDIQKREANRQFGIQNQQVQSSAQQAGAFGGYRHGLVEAENTRNQNTALNDIEDRGLQAAYAQGLGAFNQDRSALLGANQMNNQFGSQQSQLSQAAQNANNQFGMSAAQLGLQGGQLALSGSQGLAGLGQAQQAAAMGNAAALQSIGNQKQAQTQAGLDTAYSDFVNQRDYGRQNLNWLSSILRGVPVSANTNTTGYQPSPSWASQIAGLGLGGIGLAKMFS